MKWIYLTKMYYHKLLVLKCKFLISSKNYWSAEILPKIIKKAIELKRQYIKT